MTEEYMSNYKKYRGQCKRYVDEAIKEDPTLTAIRGHYWCPITGVREAHWWCKRPDGSIYDPTRLQFLSGGMGTYEEFDGNITCEECGKIVPEEKAYIDGRHTFCCGDCFGRYIGCL